MPHKVYYLDDEPDLLELFVDLFEHPSLEIVTFEHPESLIEAVKQSPPDILFIDYRLPNTNGDEVASQIDTKIPKAIITGDLAVQTTTRFDSIFHKPFNSDQILDFIKKHTQK